MKKFLLSLSVLALASSFAYAEDPIASIEFTKNSELYANVSSYTKDWNTTDEMWCFYGFNNNNRGWDFIAAGRKDNASTASIASGVVCPVPVSSIVLSVGDRLTSDAFTAKLLVADNAEFTSAVEKDLTVPTEKNKEWVVNIESPAANKFYKIALDIESMSANGQAISLTKVALYQNPYVAEEKPEPELVSVKSISEVKALDDKTKCIIDFPLTVAFVNYSNVFVTDEAGDFIQVYGSNSYKANDVIPAGWEATYTLYQTYTPELTPNAALPNSTEQSEFTPKAVNAADITVDMVNSVILVKDVVFGEATPGNKNNFTGKVGDTELTFRNNYELASVEAGTYDVTALVSVYNGAVQLYTIKYDVKSGTGVTEVAGVDNREAVYFNLQGVKIANPQKGLYIRVQGDKVSKVVLE